MTRTFHASEKSKSLSRQLSGCQRTSVREGAERLALNVTLFLPFLEVPKGSQFCGILDPTGDGSSF